MAHQNRGYQAPAFGAGRMGRRPSALSEEEDTVQQLDVESSGIHNRSNISAAESRAESRLSTSRNRGILNESHMSHRSNNTAANRSLKQGRVHGAHGDHIAPYHDPAGKPLRRHGTETIGDILCNPIRELQLHQKRFQAYENEKKEWNEKHPESIASVEDIDKMEEPVIEETRVRITLHFRHLVGDQEVVFSEDKIEVLRKPLQLTEEEVEQIKGFKESDHLIDFLEHTKRDYSVKVHKTVNLRAEIEQKKSELEKFEKSRENSFNLGEKTNTTVSTATTESAGKQSTTAPTEKHSIQKSGSTGKFEKDESRPHKNQSPTDIILDLNDNIYVQIQFIEIMKEHIVNQRRAFFTVPDPDLSDEVGEETSATWVELFGDVFYVGWITNFTHSIHIDSVSALQTYAAWFVVMWWTWCSGALYSSRYDKGDVVHHIYKIIELCGLIIMAGSSGKASFEENPRMFIIGYIIMKAVILVEYGVVFIVSLSAHFKSSRRPLGIYVAASAISIAMWGASLLYTDKASISARYALWYCSIGMEVVVHILLQGNSRVCLAASHLGERFGLFTLIILGENCMGFIQMVAEADTTSSVIACNVFGVTIIFCYFFMYFDDFSGEFMAQSNLSQLWMYLHFPLHLFQVAFGIALTNIISNHNLHLDNAESMANTIQTCAAEATSTLDHSNSSITGTVSEHAATTNGTAITAHYTMLSAAAGTESSVNCDPLFEIKTFWITAGLILCFNAFIKWVNTPIKGNHFKSHLICISRILNAIVFFALSVTTYAQLNGLAMVSIMMACLLFQSGVDLLD